MTRIEYLERLQELMDRTAKTGNLVHDPFSILAMQISEVNTNLRILIEILLKQA